MARMCFSPSLSLWGGEIERSGGEIERSGGGEGGASYTCTIQH